MVPEERRPTPEEMLARAAAERESEGARPRGGRLKIFFGAAPGVGKTYAMLEAARARLREGVDVVVGWIETHGRKETEALARDLPRIPPKELPHRGLVLAEFDVDAALARKPALLLVDELAHANAPGTRHARRWQDVAEILEAGIDVYTTLNVQHVESLNDVVAQITGVVVKETVPDTILERADDIELVDLPPDELLQRLREGKVYIPAQAERALENFFRKGNLIALRELALRRTAERVDEQAVEWKARHGIAKLWPTRERVLVAVGPAPQSANLVRAAYRMAGRLKAPWIVMSVETPAFDGLSPEARERVAAALSLGERLGAETLVVRGERVSDEILAAARERNVTRILVGKPTHPRLRDRFRGSMLDDLVRRSGAIDVLVTTGEEGEPARGHAWPRRADSRSTLREWLGAALVVTATSALCLATRGVFTLADQAMIYLLGVLLVASRCSRWPSLAAAVASVAALDFLFVPPYLTFAVADFRFVLTFGVMLLVGILVSRLTVRVREQAEAARSRERRTAALFAMSRDFAAETGVPEIARTAVTHLRDLLETDVVVMLADDEGRLASPPLQESPLALSDAERAVAQWVFDLGLPAGHGTDTLPGAEALFLPLVGTRGPIGAIGVALAKRPKLSPAQRQFLETLVAQTALALERARLAEDAGKARVQAETESTRSALLSAVSHDLRTPLASIGGAAEVLLDAGADVKPEGRRELLETIRDEAVRLSRLVADLLELTRLESGALRARKEWAPLEDVVSSALSRLEERLAGREVKVDLPDELFLVPMDPILVEQVLLNLVDNAVKYSPAGSAIDIRGRREGALARVTVADRGAGIPEGEEERIFEKFYRGSDAGRAAGAGLGLAVSAAIAKAHGGALTAGRRADGAGGAEFRLTLPMDHPAPAAPRAAKPEEPVEEGRHP